MNARRMIIAGGSGFLGQLLSRYFTDLGWQVVILTRTPKPVANSVREFMWDGETLGDWARELEGAEAVINLTGRSVNCRYHERNRKIILESRLKPTRVLGEAVSQCAKPPRVWLNSSTATIYKHTYGPAWDESGEIGDAPEARDEFSVYVATAWERAFDQARTPDTRKIAMRAAMVLGHGPNSVFPMLQRLVRFGLGGRMASGKQFVSWIHEEDVCRAIDWLLQNEKFNGVVNLAAPNPVTNAEMMRTLREICGVPFGLPAELWMLEAGAFFLRTETELIIKSRRVIPGRLAAAGFEFRFPNLRSAFENLCGKDAN